MSLAMDPRKALEVVVKLPASGGRSQVRRPVSDDGNIHPTANVPPSSKRTMDSLHCLA